MIDSYIRFSFILLMALSAFGLVGLIPLLLVQYFMHKKALDPTYFNRKHYSDYELDIFTSFPILWNGKTISYLDYFQFQSPDPVIPPINTSRFSIRNKSRNSHEERSVSY